MAATWAVVFLVAAGAWAGVLGFSIGAVPLLVKRTGMERAWPALRVLVPWLQLFGTWAGAIAIGALALGRSGIGAAWAVAMVCCALSVTAGLYGRAVLMPSLDAAFKRMRAAPDEEKWAEEWGFLWRMATLERIVALGLTLAAIACIAPLLW